MRANLPIMVLNKISVLPSSPTMFVAPSPTEMTQPATAAATPEFMWCQRGDRVYVTIKVADCQETSVDVSSDHRLEFRGRGSGMCGQREYALSIQVARPVVKEECRWFVCGPSVRVRLEKAQHGPYWGALIADGVKMAQCKVSAFTSISTATSTPTSPTSTHDPPPPPQVDWQSWLDEDEESEVRRCAD